ncbi:hypothetical protein ELG97_15025 [Rhizobium leguminosarum]|uniref:hypothetical protein n=1 Tax=Rhizobium leguminosarum TaxID=384 RepID=UPI001030ED29|nr:hypothetical protein [Rhizobium leguminosarum]TBE93128.1 hypothetical protein ELG97_15025 [Rhizobium leguminosarum]
MQAGPFDFEPVLAIYRDIENYLTGEYEVWADVTREALVEIRVRFEGIEYSFDSLYEWKSSGRYLPNFKGKPDIHDRQLAHVKNEFLRIGLWEDFDRLLAAWDLGVDNLHFEEFREQLPTFVLEFLRRAARMHPDVSASDDIVAGANQETLPSFALRGLMSDREAAAAGLLPFEAFDYLNDDLQHILEFQDIDNLVRHGKPGDVSPDAEEIAFVVSRNHFIEALHEFLVNLADARLPVANGITR